MQQIHGRRQKAFLTRDHRNNLYNTKKENSDCQPTKRTSDNIKDLRRSPCFLYDLIPKQSKSLVANNKSVHDSIFTEAESLLGCATGHADMENYRYQRRNGFGYVCDGPKVRSL
jgi:hypothetical protein